MEKYDYQMQEPGFWDDVEKSQETMKKVKALKDTVENFEALEQEYEDIDKIEKVGKGSGIERTCDSSRCSFLFHFYFT
ncbi:MAG: PCRF domain-containing protein, partial [Lachnospiraceae bacterium]|nr:PCRF domain-containing protein [Lachnospiraceae bacterium]